MSKKSSGRGLPNVMHRKVLHVRPKNVDGVEVSIVRLIWSNGATSIGAEFSKLLEYGLYSGKREYDSLAEAMADIEPGVLRVLRFLAEQEGRLK